MVPLRPMLAVPVAEPFIRAGWHFELKWDGFRTLAYLDGNRVTLFSRRGHDVTALYPELSALPESCQLPAGPAVLDGEIVAVGERGMPDFQLLQHRIGHDPLRARELAARIPVTFVAFDLLICGSADIMHHPLSERRARLAAAIAAGPGLSLSLDFGSDGVSLFEEVRQRGLEGVIGKRLASPYVPGTRTRDWQKVKCRLEQDCVILGWTPGEQARGFGSLVAGIHAGGQLRYAGRVGSGFDSRTISNLLEILGPLAAPGPPQTGSEALDLASLQADRTAWSRPLDGRAVHWVRPELCFAVEFSEWTKGGQLRQPVFRGLRPDKAPAECAREIPRPRPGP